MFDFVTNNPSVTSSHAALNLSGISVATNPTTGSVLFYTDGINIYDRNHILMPNGTGLLGHQYTVQSGQICPNPANSNQYYVFSNNGESPTSGSVHYSIVDMTLAGNGSSSNPLGDVVSGQKNIFLVDQTTEACYTVFGGAGVYWILIPQINTTNIRLFKVTSSGIILYSTYNTGINNGNSAQIKYSYTAKKLALANMIESQASYIVSFDNISGVFSNPYSIPGTPMGSGDYTKGIFECEWSEDGTKLYFSKYRMSISGGRLYQYDLNNQSQLPIVVYNLSTSNTSYIAKGLKRGPDGKIYFMYVNSNGQTRYLGIVNNPNISGNGCNFVANGIDLGLNIGNCHKFPEFLPPEHCDIFSTNNPTYSISYDCRLGPDMIYNLPVDSLVNNSCGLSISVGSVQVQHGTATVSGTTVVYHQPPQFVTGDQIQIQLCDQWNNCHTSVVTVNYIYSGPPEPIIWQSGDTLFSDAIHSIQWYCDGVPIAGANEPLYIPTQACTYSVSSTFNYCSDTSQPFIWTPVLQRDRYNGIEVYPNPAKDGIFISTEAPGMYEVSLLDATGRVLVTQQYTSEGHPLAIGLAGYEAGIYIVRISCDGKAADFRFVKY